MIRHTSAPPSARSSSAANECAWSRWSRATTRPGTRFGTVAATGWSRGSRGRRAPPWPRRTRPASPPGAGCGSASGSSGSGFGFGIFFEGRFTGEVTLSSIQRGPFQNGSIGYWIDEEAAGQGLIPEAVVVVLKFAFETLRLHRIEVAIIPRNRPSRRVVEKLGMRSEGVALGFLEINGEWEDHVRYAMTAEEWAVQRRHLVPRWIGSD